MKREAEEKTLHQMAKVNNFLERWQGSQNPRATQKESRAQNKEMTAIEQISDSEEIIKAFWSNFEHDGAAAFKLLEKSPLAPDLSATDLPEGRTQALNVRRIKRIDHHSAKSDEDSLPESIADTENWLNWNGYLDNPNDSEDNWEADNESDMELDNCREDSETRQHRIVSAAPNVPGLIPPTRRSKQKVEKAFMMVNILELRSNKGIKKK